jgi:hypothetical protein
MPILEVTFGRIEDEGPGEPRFCVEIAPPDHYRLFRGKTNMTQEQFTQAVKRMGILEEYATQILNLGIHETSGMYTVDLNEEVAAEYGWTKG